MRRQFTAITLASAVAIGGVIALAPMASAKDSDQREQRARGACSAGSTFTARLRDKDSAIRTEFAVKNNQVDQAWTYTATRNGLQVVSSTRVSRASDDDSSDDSFHAAEVKWRNYLTGTPGAASAFVLRAVNGATGEICTWSTTR